MNARADVELDDDLNRYGFMSGAEVFHFGPHDHVSVEVDGSPETMIPRDILAAFDADKAVKLFNAEGALVRITEGVVNRSFGVDRCLQLKYVEDNSKHTLTFLTDVILIAIRVDDPERKLQLMRVSKLSADWEVNIPAPKLVASNVGKSVAPDLKFHRITEIEMSEIKT